LGHIFVPVTVKPAPRVGSGSLVDTVKNYSLPYLVALQNLVALCHAMYVGVCWRSQKFECADLCVDCLNVCFLYFVYDFIIIIIIIIPSPLRCKAMFDRKTCLFHSWVTMSNQITLRQTT